ncbi:MAG TPA: hypothetical protein VF939_24550 [Puia sp.]
MHRRHFIQWTGAALSGLVFSPWAGAAASTAEKITLPSGVLVGLDDGEHLLQPDGKGVYRYREISVRLPVSGNSREVVVESPRQALHYVRLLWNLPSLKPASVLGDHWERTYGDLGFCPPSFDKKMPWYFIAWEGPTATCFGVKTGCNSIAYWQAGDHKLQLTLDTRSGGVGVQLGDRALTAAAILTTRSQGGENVFATGRRFCGLLCEKPRETPRRIYGINDWYYAYGNNNPALILAQTALMTDLAQDTANRPFSLVDAGWAYYSPLLPGDGGWNDDFSRPNDKFKDMGKLAGQIKKLGMRPALWTRPLCAAHDDPASLLLPAIPGRDDPKYPVLDPTIEENLGRVRRNIGLYREWGYEMVKHDFTTFDILGKWGFQMKEDITTAGWRFRDNSRTTAEIMLALYKTIRDAAGEQVYIIGCNTMSHLSAGIFEMNRVGDDTSGKEWERTRKMGVNTLGFRMIQHDHFYAADGDCVGLTKEVPWSKNKQWMQLIAGSGTPLFISAQPDAMGAEQKQVVRESFALAARRLPAGEPLDWLTNPFPKEWKLNGEKRVFDWG